MRLKSLLVLTCLLFNLLKIPPLHAQAANASLRGVITDPSAASVPNASLTVSNGQGFSRTTRADDKGRYQLNSLPAGTYNLRVAATGFSLFEQKTYIIADGKQQTLDIALALKTQTEEVTVGAETAAAVDTNPVNNADALVLSKPELDALPDDPDDPRRRQSPCRAQSVRLRLLRPGRLAHQEQSHAERRLTL